MGTLLQDLKYALRMQVRSIGFTSVAVLTIGLGIGASTAVFSVVNAILLKPLPYAHSDRVVIPWRLAPAGLNLGYNEIPWGQRPFRLISDEAKTFEYLGAFKSASFNLTGNGEPALVEGLRVSAGFFPTLGVAPVSGHTFARAEDQPGHEHEVVLSYDLWQKRFGGSYTVAGSTIDLNGEPYTVVGIMPAGFVFPHSEEMPGSFDFPRQAQLWVPLALPPSPPPNAPSDLAVIGRLLPGISVEQAQEEMNVLATRIESEFPRFKGWFTSRVTPLTRQVAGDTRTPLLLIMAAVGVVLLIACSNVANLLLARSLGRKAEFTVRAALGAGQARLVRQLLSESLLLAAVGGIVGLLLAEAGIYFVQIFEPSNIPRLGEISLDFRVYSFLLAVTFLSGILFGLAPAIGATRQGLMESLRESGPRSRALSGGIRNTFLVAQVALALVLVVAAGLLSRTFFHLLNADPGFRADQALTFELSLSPVKYPDNDHIVTLYQNALQRLQAISGVTAAGIVNEVPMTGATEGSVIRIPDRPVSNEQERPFANYTVASPGYFSAVGTPLLRGREFLDSDHAESQPVVIINNAMAQKFWRGEDPVGKQVGLGSLRFPLMTIVGIVADVKHLSMREAPGPEMYVPYTQKPYPSLQLMHVVVRSRIDPASLASTIRDELHAVDP